MVVTTIIFNPAQASFEIIAFLFCLSVFYQSFVCISQGSSEKQTNH